MNKTVFYKCFICLLCIIFMLSGCAIGNNAFPENSSTPTKNIETPENTPIPTETIETPTSTPYETDEWPISISIISLIATPEKYHGKKVRVIGIVHIQFEINEVYFSSEDYRKGIEKNALWIEPNYEALDMTYDEIKELNGKTVRLEGIFNAENQGNWGAYSGAIENITRYDEYPWQ